MQHAKKAVSNSPGLVDLAIGLANFVRTCNLSDRQVKFFRGIEITEKNVQPILLIKKFWGLAEMNLG